MKLLLLVIGLSALLLSTRFPPLPDQSFEQLKNDFIKGFIQLNLPEFTYDYRRYFSSIPSSESLKHQEAFFESIKAELASVDTANLSAKNRLDFETIQYRVRFNLMRLHLEQEWIQEGRKIPPGGLYTIDHHKEWYQYFIQKFTSTDITPEKVFELGQQEVTRAKNEIDKIRTGLGYDTGMAFYSHLDDSGFFLTDKKEIITRFKTIDSIVRYNLAAFVDPGDIPPVYPMEWPDAGPGTPPGIYINRVDNAYGKDVFQFNFYQQHYNWRAMEWLYMHEAVPGHHLQTSLRERDALSELFLYPGNFEGWGCYVEYYGKQLGLYTNPYMELGKWEWDLVRSLRLVLDVGIHYYGWSKEEALTYWKNNIKGQDGIAEREISRVTSWAAQTLSYKVGASCIFLLQEKWLQKNPDKDLKDFRKWYLKNGMVPLLAMMNIGGASQTS